MRLPTSQSRSQSKRQPPRFATITTSPHANAKSWSSSCSVVLLSDIETMLTDDELLSLCVIANRDGAGVRLPYWAGAKLEPQVATMGMRAGAPTQQPQGIWLNAEGKRCCNEFAPIREFVDNSLAFKPRDTYYCIYDANYANTWDHLCPGHSSITPNIAYKACLDDVLANAPSAEGLYTAENGQFQVRISMYGAETIEELFEKPALPTRPSSTMQRPPLSATTRCAPPA